MEHTARIYVAGHTGLLGSALVRALKARGYQHLVTRTVSECDLRDQHAVHALFEQTRPEYVFIAAAKVGGIRANRDAPAEFAYDNLMIATNLIHAAHIYKVKKTLVLGSSCIYPRDTAQPITESSLLTGPLEETNKPYAVAKIAALVLAQSYTRQYQDRFICAMPTNLYGPGDNFDLHTGHVIPALIARIVHAHVSGAPTVTIGGSGRALREFLYVDDCADALIHLMQQYYEIPDIINIGSGAEISIADLVELIVKWVGYAGAVTWDLSFPEGTPRKKLDTNRMKSLGWSASTSLSAGIEKTIGWYYEQYIQQNNSPALPGRCWYPGTGGDIGSF